MKNFFKTILALIFLLASVIPIGCGNQASAKDFYYFNTEIHVETHDKTMSNDTVQRLNALFSSLEEEFDLRIDDSFTSAFNSCTSTTLSISERASEILVTAKECWQFTGGLFNPSVYPLVELWQFAPVYPVLNFTPPTSQAIAQTLNDYSYDFSSLTLDLEHLKVTTPEKSMQIDLGGILKGYAADKSAKILKDAGHTSGYVAVGSSSLNLLSVKSLGIRHPRATDSAPLIITVDTDGQKNLSVSTSGDYQKYYEYDGKRYSHLINPSSGYPADSSIISATIIGVDGTVADALTTALCLLEYTPTSTSSPLTNMIKKITTTYPEASVYAVYLDEERKLILTNKKQGEDFTLHDTDYEVINV